jgi:hypothetical protein
VYFTRLVPSVAILQSPPCTSSKISSLSSSVPESVLRSMLYAVFSFSAAPSSLDSRFVPDVLALDDVEYALDRTTREPVLLGNDIVRDDSHDRDRDKDDCGTGEEVSRGYRGRVEVRNLRRRTAGKVEVGGSHRELEGREEDGEEER